MQFSDDSHEEQTTRINTLQVGLLYLNELILVAISPVSGHCNRPLNLDRLYHFSSSALRWLQ